MEFVKMHGLGNDFVFVQENMISQFKDLGSLARKVCDRHFGVGADGLIIVADSKIADSKMRMFNPNGSEAEMCGNAIRCFAKYLYERGMITSERMTVETLAGMIKPRLIFDQGILVSVEVDMGKPKLAPEEIPVNLKGNMVVDEHLSVGDNDYGITCVSMGNPHCVIFTTDVEGIILSEWGPRIQKHPIFPQSVNVEFVQVTDAQNIKMRVWERGAGETLACGTGACASVVAAVLNNKCHNKVNVSLLGGDLTVNWDKRDHVFMTGPAEEVFSGKMPIK